MVAKKKSGADAIPAFSLQDGFTAIEPNKKWLNTARLQTMLNVRSRVNTLAHGLEQHNKLLKFCEKCLEEGHDETIVTVVAEANHEESVSYQCLFECNGSKDSFILKGSFFRDFEPPSENKTKTTSASMSANA